MTSVEANGNRILVVDDDPDVLGLLQYILEQEAYVVDVARSGVEALKIVEGSRPDIMVVDLMMPGMDGVELCRRVRQNPRLSEIPILVLTALSEQIHEIQSLDAGADDYVTKPIAPKLFLSHVRALLRRSSRGTENEKGLLEVKNLRVDRSRYLVVLHGDDGATEYNLPRKEFDLLYFLASHPGRVFSRQELLDQVWGSDVFVIDRTIDVHVRKIREKLGREYIQTVRGRGYKFGT